MSRQIWLLRHGSTEWTQTGQHTGRRDVPLDESGRSEARAAGEALDGRAFGRVLVSPQDRAVETCRLAGYGAPAVAAPDLVEWDYGEYEGLTDEQTRARQPDWDMFRDGCPGGEDPGQVAARAGRLMRRCGRRPVQRSWSATARCCARSRRYG